MKQITMRYTHARKLGYGRFAMDIRNGLEKVGWKVFDGITGDPGQGLKSIDYGKTKHILWATIPSHALGWLEGQHNHVFTMWEATFLPEVMRENLPFMETVIVPSQQNLELFSHYHDNVHLCYLGCDTEHWYYQERKPMHPWFNFLTAGSGLRKGSDLTYQAFALAFPDWETLNPQPHLVHKSPRGSEFSAPWMHTVSTYISDEEEIQLYGDCHVYVAASRGEGFGLQPLQAMAQGMPTILTNAHGHTAFADLGWPINAGLVQAGPFMAGDAGEWWEANVYDLADTMRHVYEDYDNALVKAKESSEVVAREFSLEAMTQRVTALLPEDLGPYTGTGKWVQPDSRRFLVVTSRDWKGEVAGNTIICEQGKEYWLHADTKRVLFDNGALHPSCVEAEMNRGKPIEEWVDTGITVAQQKDWDARGKHIVCPTCEQVVGSGKKMSDVLYEERYGPLPENGHEGFDVAYAKALG
jgi:hypothetical protein